MSDVEVVARAFSVILGWVYFFAWSISFYPQIFLNHRRKFVGGLSIDFATLNVIGHSCYAVYSTAFLFDSQVRDEYRRRHGGHDPSVHPNDVAFAIHAATLASITLIQTWIYPRAPGQRLSPANHYLIIITLVVFAMNLFSVFVGRESAIDLLYLLSYFKLYVSVAKYIPQAWDNYSRKSTIGWSIENVLLDMIGGCLSLIQLFIDAMLDNDWSAIIGNPVKFGLSSLTIIFDIIFIVQHYVLYTDREDTTIEAKRPRSPDVEVQASPAAAGNGHRQSTSERTSLLPHA